MGFTRGRILSAGVGALGVALISGTPYSRAASHAGHKGLAPHAEAVVASGEHVVDTFELRAVNTMETVTVRYVDGVIDPASKQQVDYVMRCLRTEGGKPIDPRLVDMLHAIAGEVGGHLDLVSGYRAPKSWHEHNFHNRGEAADIRVPGMPARKLRSVAKKLGIKGIGWYPTTNMIHVDVRDEEYFWIDWSGPNQIGREMRIRY
ncbi:MAG TPA: DUF882 domain-containing protein [Polyangiaceae bacterium]|jgi:uncharacterized protein YcbK (DUF882 family)